MNIFIHLGSSNLDLLDNPFFSIKPYIMDDNINYYAREPKKGELELIKCPQSEIAKYTGKNNAQFFQGSICFKDPEKIELNANWWRPKFRNIMIAYEKCVDSP